MSTYEAIQYVGTSNCGWPDQPIRAGYYNCITVPVPSLTNITEIHGVIKTGMTICGYCTYPGGEPIPIPCNETAPWGCQKTSNGEPIVQLFYSTVDNPGYWDWIWSEGGCMCTVNYDCDIGCSVASPGWNFNIVTDFGAINIPGPVKWLRFIVADHYGEYGTIEVGGIHFFATHSTTTPPPGPQCAIPTCNSICCVGDTRLDPSPQVCLAPGGWPGWWGTDPASITDCIKSYSCQTADPGFLEGGQYPSHPCWGWLPQHTWKLDFLNNKSFFVKEICAVLNITNGACSLYTSMDGVNWTNQGNITTTPRVNTSYHAFLNTEARYLKWVAQPGGYVDGSWFTISYTCSEVPCACSEGEIRNQVECWDGSLAGGEVCQDCAWVPIDTSCPVQCECSGTGYDPTSKIDCWDGSDIYYRQCDGCYWQSTGQQCPICPCYPGEVDWSRGEDCCNGTRIYPYVCNDQCAFVRDPSQNCPTQYCQDSAYCGLGTLCWDGKTRQYTSKCDGCQCQKLSVPEPPCPPKPRKGTTRESEYDCPDGTPQYEKWNGTEWVLVACKVRGRK